MLYYCGIALFFQRRDRWERQILLVDDEVEITDIHQRYLVQTGYQVLVAHDGVEALEIFKRKPIDFDYYRYHDASDGWL